MSHPLRLLMVGAVAALSVGATTAASATTIGLTSSAGFGPVVSTYDLTQLGTDGTVLTGAQTVTGSPSNAVTVSSSAGTFNRVDEGGSWFSNFATGAALVSTNTEANSDLTFSLTHPVQEFGVQIAAATWGDFTATETLYNKAGTEIGSYSEPGTSALLGDNSAIFIGFASSAGDIAKATFTIASAVTGGTNDFAVGGVVSAVPLPAGLPLFASALVGLAAVARRKAKRVVG